MAQAWSSLKERAGKLWQIPGLVLAGMLLIYSVVQLRPSPSSLPLSDVAELMKGYVDGGIYEWPIEIGWRVLKRQNKADTEKDRAAVRIQLARAMYGSVMAAGGRSSRIGSWIVEQYTLAKENGAKLGSGDYERLGRALEWTQRYGDAVDAYTEAVALSDKPELELRKHMYLLLRDRLQASDEALNALADSMMKDARPQSKFRLWVLEEKLYLLAELDRLPEATTLLLRNRDEFEHTPLYPSYRYLEALQLYHSGAYDQAETLLRAIRNGLSVADPLHAKTGWLLGRVVMYDKGPERPMEALSFFQDVIAHHSEGPYVTASRVGAGEAFAYMQRHREATNAFRDAIDEERDLEPNRLVSAETLRTALTVLSESMRQKDELEAAVEYSRLASTLIDWKNGNEATATLQQLAELRRQYAQELEDKAAGPVDSSTLESPSKEARRQYELAGEAYLDLARVSAVNDERAARNSWQAAAYFARAGDRARAIQLFRAFVKEHPQHSLVARALLRIGQIEQEARRLKEAVAAYQECYRRFPRVLDGARALVPLAQCYVGLGPSQLDMAEKTLKIVLAQSELFTPAAPEFADALFLLGDVEARRGAFEESIALLEEALKRYPDDPRAMRARFLMADAYRQSGLALKSEISQVQLPGEIKQMRLQSYSRFAEAARLFRQLITALDDKPVSKLDRLERIYRLNSRLYEADCYFEMKRYADALELYEAAAGLFKDRPASLAAYVQIINCHVFLGRPAEARAALGRAQVLVNDMPQVAFDQSISPEGREDWKRYFNWLGESELLESTG